LVTPLHEKAFLAVEKGQKYLFPVLNLKLKAEYFLCSLHIGGERKTGPGAEEVTKCYFRRKEVHST